MKKENGLCVLDMIQVSITVLTLHFGSRYSCITPQLKVLQRLRIAQDLVPETKRVLTYIGDGNIICFSTHFKARANADYSDCHVIRFNLYTDDIFELFSTHLGAA